MIPFTAIVLISILTACQSVDPGIVISIRESFLHQVSSQILPGILQNYNSFSVPDQSQDDCSMTNINSSLEPIAPDTITLTLVEANNGIAADFSQINSSTSITFTCQFFETVSGTLTFVGPLSATAEIDISSTPEGDVSYVPQISSVSHFNVDADSNKFSINFDCNPSCGSWERDAISTVLTDVVLPGAIEIIETGVPAALPSIVNPQIKSQFPVSFQIPNTPFSIQTGLTSTPSITNNVFTLPIDATLFRTSDGYSRNGSLVILPGEDSSLSEGVQIQISDYVVQNALVLVSYDQQLNLTYTIAGFTFELYVDPQINTGAEFTSGGFKAFAQPHFSIYKEGGSKLFGLKLGTSIFLDFAADGSVSDTDTTDVTIRLENLAFNNIHVELGSLSLNLSLLKYPLNILLWLTVKAVDEFGLKHVISVPKQTFQGFTIESADSHFHDGYVTAGVDVSYLPTS